MPATRLFPSALAGAVLALAIPAIALAQSDTSSAPTQSAPADPEPAAAAPPAGSGPVEASQLAPGQVQALQAGDNKLVTNGPVPDTAANRARYGAPMSQTGKKTKPAGN